MIALCGRNHQALLGVASMLDIEKIPYRRTTALDQRPGELLLLAGDELGSDEIAAAERGPSLVLNGGAAFASRVFRAGTPVVHRGACRIALDPALWPDEAMRLAASLGETHLRLPMTTACHTARTGRGIAHGTVSAAGSPAAAPAAVCAPRCVWSPVDLGEAFFHLLREGSVDFLRGAPFETPPEEAAPQGERLGRWILRAFPLGLRRPRLPSSRLEACPEPCRRTRMRVDRQSRESGEIAAAEHRPVRLGHTLYRAARRAAESAYYVLPESIRQRIRHGYYARLDRRLAAAAGEQVSTYPADATGWLLLELLKHLIRLAGGSLMRLERWPAPYRSAATITHDIEPTAFANTAGVRRLLARAHTPPACTAVGLVATAAGRHLDNDTTRLLAPYEVYAHGLTHRGDPVDERAAVADGLRAARTRLEACLDRPVHGYRSPRLDRSGALAWALDHCGFAYDSSFPDVDRENPGHYGGGVRLNLPHRAPIADPPGHWRPSRCLELPLTAPDCIQPLFAGHPVERLRAAVRTKADFVRRTGGLYVALVHAGVFGDADADRREDHLAAVWEAVRHPDTWLTTPGAVADWWQRREQLRLEVRDDSVLITNEGEGCVGGIRLVADHPWGSTSFDLPPLAPGASAAVQLPRCSAPAA